MRETYQHCRSKTKSEPSGPPSQLPDVKRRGEEEGGKKNEMCSHTLLPTTNNKCNSTQKSDTTPVVTPGPFPLL